MHSLEESDVCKPHVTYRLKFILCNNKILEITYAWYSC